MTDLNLKKVMSWSRFFRSTIPMIVIIASVSGACKARKSQDDSGILGQRDSDAATNTSWVESLRDRLDVRNFQAMNGEICGLIDSEVDSTQQGNAGLPRISLASAGGIKGYCRLINGINGLGSNAVHDFLAQISRRNGKPVQGCLVPQEPYMKTTVGKEGASLTTWGCSLGVQSIRFTKDVIPLKSNERLATVRLELKPFLNSGNEICGDLVTQISDALPGVPFVGMSIKGSQGISGFCGLTPGPNSPVSVSNDLDRARTSGNPNLVRKICVLPSEEFLETGLAADGSLSQTAYGCSFAIDRFLVQ